MPYGQQQQQNFYYPQRQVAPMDFYPQPGMLPQAPLPQLKGRPVSSIEEARAAQIDFDGSVFTFPDINNKKIYTKQINLDGTVLINTYSLIEDTTPAPVYVTKEELETAIKEVKSLIAPKF